MKKKILSIMAVLVVGTCVACSNPAEDAANTITNMNDTVSDVETILGDYKETMGNLDLTGENATNGNSQGSVQTNNTSLDDYVFEYNGVKIAPDMNTNEFLNKLGQPLHYYEVQSCAFEGMDKIYTYGSFEISTYPNGQNDLVSYITFKDDTVSTQEGVYLFMSKKDVLAVYGNNYIEKAGAYIYSKGGMELRFIFENDSLISIEYATTVLD